MNINIVKNLIEYIEENYHSNISNEVIEDITGKSSGYVRNEFKKIVNISVDEYRIRRQLTLIIQEMKNNNKKLNNSNLLPWNTENSFCKAFKSNFNEPPMQFIKNYNEYKLQPKFDIERFNDCYNRDTKTIEGLIRKFDNKTNVLKYIFSLKPYKLNSIDSIFKFSGGDIKYFLIKARYAQEIKKKFFAGKVPKKFYNKHSKIIDKYYDTEKLISLKQFDEKDISLPQGYILVKKSIINRILEKVELDTVINDKTDPKDVVTLWFDEIKSEPVKAGMISMPNDLVESGLGMMKWTILSELIVQEQGFVKYTTMEELRDRIQYDYCKPINIYSEYCESCKFKGDCDNEYECQYIQELSEQEKDEFYDKPDHEVLTIERLCEEIKELFIEGLIYLNYYEEVK